MVSPSEKYFRNKYLRIISVTFALVAFVFSALLQNYSNMSLCFESKGTINLHISHQEDSHIDTQGCHGVHSHQENHTHRTSQCQDVNLSLFEYFGKHEPRQNLSLNFAAILPQIIEQFRLNSDEKTPIFRFIPQLKAFSLQKHIQTIRSVVLIA